MRTPLRTVLVLIAGSLALTAFSLTAAAQAWPSRPIHFIVPFPAGGSTDVGARVVAEYLSRTLGLQIVIENKSGANGNLAIETGAKSAPDGYTVLVSTDAVSTNPHVYQMSIDPLKDLVPVIQLSRQPIALAAHPSLGVSTLAELTALRQEAGLVRSRAWLHFGTRNSPGSAWNRCHIAAVVRRLTISSQVTLNSAL
jgi:tripartite-type tricarboxylate transporter receptor subunit TctC